MTKTFCFLLPAFFFALLTFLPDAVQAEDSALPDQPGQQAVREGSSPLPADMVLIRFPGGDTIAHCQANYHSSSSYAYDSSPTRGHHPLWRDGSDYPYTAPAGFFDGTLKLKTDYNWPGDAASYETADGANSYGLYDMASFGGNGHVLFS